MVKPEDDAPDLQVQCCFCGKQVAKSSVGGDALDPCAVLLIARWDRPDSEQGTQQFFCHIACFERASEHAHVEREVLEEGTG